MKLTRVCMWVRVKSNKHDSHNKHYKQQHTNTTSRRRTYSTAQDTQRPAHSTNAAHNTTQRTQRATHCIFWHKGDFDPCFGLFFDLAFFTNVEDMGASSTMSKTCRRHGCIFDHVKDMQERFAECTRNCSSSQFEDMEWLFSSYDDILA